MPFRTQHVKTAIRDLKRRDPVMRAAIKAIGPFRLRGRRDRFGMLVQSIISQQISVNAARSIRRRLTELVAPESVRPEVLVQLDADKLRTAGVSPQKSRYLLDLARRVDAGTLRLNQLGRLSDERVIDELTQVCGVGVWTAQMFLIFALCRFDVFPVDDLGIRTAIARLYGFTERPGVDECHEIAARWQPYRTVACWYCWRSLDVPRDTQ